MGSELLLYGYGFVCVSMLIFNVAYSLSLKRKDRRLKNRDRRFARRVDRQLDRLRTGEGLERGHLTYLRRKLSRVDHLAAFDRMVMERLEGAAEDREAARAYQREIQPVILHLALFYRDREDIQAAYFAYFLSRHRPQRHQAMDAIQDVMVKYMGKESLYCRVNALQALCGFGSPESVAEAVTALDRGGRFLHEKVLTDGLLSFTGSHERLTALLLERFDSFSVPTRLSVLNYIRFCSGAYGEQMMNILSNPAEDKELRLSAIRYFGRYPMEEARPLLLALAADKEPTGWEYASIAVSVLAGYQGGDVQDALTAAIYSANWYVRSNAAASLARQGLDYSDLISVVAGGDRYVREMMLYQLDLRREQGEKTAL